LKPRGRWRDLWWETLVGLTIVAGIVWLAWYAPQPYADQITRAIPGRRAYVAVVVAIGATVTARSYRSLRRSAVFWTMAAAFLALFTVSAYAWFSIGGLGLRWGIWVGPIFGAEFAPFAYLVHRKFHVLPKAKG
jgi:hypothetical protein